MKSSGGSSPSERRRTRRASDAGAAEQEHASASPPSPSSLGTAGNYVATSVAAGLLAPNESRASALDRARVRLHQNTAQAIETPMPQAAAAKPGTTTTVANEPTIAERTDLPALEMNDPSTVGVDIAPAPSGSESSPVQHSPKATIAASATPSTPSPSKASPLQFITAATASKATPDGQTGKAAAIAVPATATRVVAQAVRRETRHPGGSRSPPCSPQQQFLMNAFASASSILAPDVGGPQMPNLGSNREKGAVSRQSPLSPAHSQADEGVEYSLVADADGPTVNLHPNLSQESNVTAEEDAAVVDAELLDSVGNFIDSLNRHGQQPGRKDGPNDLDNKRKIPATERQRKDAEDAAAAIDKIRSDDEEEDAAAAFDESRSTDNASEEDGNEVDPAIRENIGAFIDSLQHNDNKDNIDCSSSGAVDKDIVAVQEQEKDQKEAAGSLEFEDETDAFVLDINALEAATMQGDLISSDNKDESSQGLFPGAKANSDDIAAKKEPSSPASVSKEEVDVCNEDKSTALRAIEEYKTTHAPAEGMSPSDEEMLELYVGKAAYLLESKVPIKDAAKQILRSSRKHGVADDMVIKIFQALKAVGNETNKTGDQPDASQTTTTDDEPKFLAGVEQEKAITQADSTSSSDDIASSSDNEERLDEKTELNADSPSLAHPSRSSDRYQEAKPSAVNSEYQEDYDSDISETFQRKTKTVAEMRNITGDSGDVEVYLMDEENVEVAYVDEADEAVGDEKGRKDCRESNETSAGAIEKNNDAPLKADEDDVIPPQRRHAVKVQRKTRRGIKANKACKGVPNESIPSAADEELAPVASYEYYPGEPMEDFKKLIKRQQIFEKQSKEEDVAESSHLGGVAAAVAIIQRSPRHKSRSSKVLHSSKTPVYRQSYEERTREHSGYSEIHFYSLSDATAINQEAHRLDEDSWEDRDVKQRFLHEKSISLSRNWFGKSSAFFNPHDARVYLPISLRFYFYLPRLLLLTRAKHSLPHFIISQAPYQ